MSNTIKHVFFDLDHTLWDFDRNSKLAFERLFVKHQIAIDIEDFITVYEPINIEFWRLFRNDEITKQELRRGRFSRAFQPFGITLSNEELDLLATAYIDELPKDNHLFDGVLDVLEYLVQRYELHIITNGFHEVQHLKLRNSGISGYFKTITTSEETGLKKPNPVIFQKALEKAFAIPHQSLMVGDSFEADILGAASVGMETLFFNYRREEIPPGYQRIDQISEILIHL